MKTCSPLNDRILKQTRAFRQLQSYGLTNLFLESLFRFLCVIFYNIFCFHPYCISLFCMSHSHFLHFEIICIFIICISYLVYSFTFYHITVHPFHSLHLTAYAYHTKLQFCILLHHCAFSSISVHFTTYPFYI